MRRLRVLLQLLLPLLLAAAPAIPQTALDVVVPVPAPPDERISQVYSVSVNGKPVPVIVYEAQRTPGWGASDTPRRLAIAAFSFAGQANVAVKMDRPVPAGWRLGPASLRISATTSGDTVRFGLQRPAKMMLHWGGWHGLPQDGSLPERLIIFADTLEGNVPVSGRPGVIDVVQRGADPRGEAPSGAAIQAAIDEAGALNGATVLAPPGRYLLERSLIMRPRVRLHVSAGALLTVTRRLPGGEVGVVSFDGAGGASLTGRGTITYNGSRWRNDAFGQPDFDHPTLVYVRNSPGAVVRDITLRDSANVHLFIRQTRGARVTGVKLVTDTDFPNTDGISPNDGSPATYVDDVFIHNTDDAIVGGTGAPFADWSTSSVVVYQTHNGGVIKGYGFDFSRFQRFSFENIDAMHTWEGIDVLTGPLGSQFTDFWVKGMRVERTVQSTLIAFVGDVRCEAPGRQGSIWRIRLVDVSFANAGEALFNDCKIPGLVGAPPTADGPRDIQDVLFTGVRIAGRTMRSLADLEKARFRNNEWVSGIAFIDEAPPQVNVRVSSLYAALGQPASFIITRSRGNGLAAATVRYRVHGSARPGIDYTALPGSVVIPAGATSVEVPVQPRASNARAVQTVAIVLQPAPQNTDTVLGPGSQAQIAIDLRAR